MFVMFSLIYTYLALDASMLYKSLVTVSRLIVDRFGE